MKLLFFVSFFQVPNCEGRAGMAAILDKDNSLNLVTLAEGIQKKLPFFARPLFVRCLSHVEMTGKLGNLVEG